MSNVFRKEALQKLQSPDRLNEMVQITSPRSWFALAGVAGIILASLVWGFFGSIPENVNGSGILIQPGGVVDVASMGSGTMRSIVVREGDRVVKGDAVAYLSLPELEMQIENIYKKLADIRGYYEELTSFDKKDLAIRNKLLEQKEALQHQIISSNEELITFYEEKIQQQEQLLEEGLITKETLMQTRNRYYILQQENEELKRELQAVGLDLFETEQKREVEEKQVQMQIFEWERKLGELNAMMRLNGTIKSPASGRVIEILANAGNYIGEGEIILKVEQNSESEKLEAITYIIGTEGKRIEPGMKVKLSPSTIEVEEYGFIWGTVTYVSEYPSSYQGMLRILGNENLVNSFMSEDNPPIAVRVTLDRDSTTRSGFKWTSGRGPDAMIRTGTICQTKIVVDEKSPMELLFVQMDKLKSVERW